jgi:DNA-binding NarL/FixJ family response regulator
MTTDKLRVYLAEDHHVVRAGLKALIVNQPDMAVVGEAGDGRKAVEEAEALRPDVIVMDVTMPVMGGAEATRLLRDTCPGTKILALTVHEDRGYFEQLVQAGASGYVLKRAVADDLIHAIRTVAKGGSYLDPTIAGLVMGGLVRAKALSSPGRDSQLTDREAEVLKLVARGFTNREIGAKLDVSVKTIETHKARAMEKLGLDSRAEIVTYAVQRGWLAASAD